MWENYKMIRLLANAPQPEWACFAIITAWNPASTLRHPEENDAHQQDLLNQLINFPLLEVWGCSPDLSWRERSVAVACPLALARQLAIRFGQNAIYWVDQGELWLVPVLLHHEETVSLGPLVDYWIASAPPPVK
jgi:hypothetical protein